MQFFVSEEGLHALQVSAPAPVALLLLDILHRLGVVLAAFEVQVVRAQKRLRLALVEVDGTAIREARLHRVQAEILLMVEQTAGQGEKSPR